MKPILRTLLERIETKTTWGKNELKFLILEVLGDYWEDLNHSAENKLRSGGPKT